MSVPKPTAVPRQVPLDHPVNRKITVDLVDLTPELAEKWLSKNTRNRNVRSAKVREFATDMRNGKWHTAGDAIQFDWNGVMTNGQHRCQAVIDSGVTIRVLVMRGMDPVTRTVIDTGSKRTAADALKFEGIEKNTNLLAAVARISMARAAGYLQQALSGTYPVVSHSDTIEWVESNPNVTFAAELARTTFRTFGIAPAPLAYCIYELEQINGPLAVEFITSAAEYRTSGQTDPRKVMLDVFHAAAQGKRRKVTVAEAIYVIFTAWNAYAKGVRITTVKPRGTNGDERGAVIPKPVKPTRAAA